MKLFQAIIIDDEIHAANLLSLSLKELFPNIRVEQICTEWSDAFHNLKENYYDLIFADIMMPGRTGIELMHLLPGLKGKIVFITAHQQYALDAFQCFASGYILKPIDDVALHRVTSKAIADIEKTFSAPLSRSEGVLGVPDNKGIDYIALKDIIYLESENKCTRIILKDKTIVSTYNIGYFKKYLNNTFFQPHRSYIINLKAVKRYLYNHTSIIMENNAEIPLARLMRAEFMKHFTTLGKETGQK